MEGCLQLLISRFRFTLKVNDSATGGVYSVKILVIEDNESVSSMIELFFSKEGIEG